MMTKLQITKNNIFLLLTLALSLSMLITGTVGLITYAQTSSETGTIVPITPSGGVVFQNTGWNPKSFTVNTQSIMNDKKIYVEMQVTPDEDPYNRFFVLSVNGQVINPAQLAIQRSFGDGIGPYYTDIFAGPTGTFTAQYDVTSEVSGKSTSIVLMGLTAYAYPWTIQANFLGQSGDPTINIAGYTLALSEILAGLGILSLIGAVWLKEKSD